LLNDLELECLRAAAVGRTDWEIGQSMSLRESEVRAMIEQAQRKLGVSSRIQAIIAALQRKELAF
jgi:DNA-binding CsgD family transcriptional regulator